MSFVLPETNCAFFSQQLAWRFWFRSFGFWEVFQVHFPLIQFRNIHKQLADIITTGIPSFTHFYFLNFR